MPDQDPESVPSDLASGLAACPRISDARPALRRRLGPAVAAAIGTGFFTAAAIGAGADPPLPETVSFNRDVRPILSETCFPCHGPDENARRAKLRLDIPDAAFALRDGEAALEPGNPDQSLAWQRITDPDPDEQMPPPDSHLALTDGQKSILHRWIEQGAAYEQHWAFIPPDRPEPPAVADESWPANPIDRFVLARLEAEGLAPSPAAPDPVLARRLHLDLTGLPPSSEELAETVASIRSARAAGTPLASSPAVQSLLRSSAFGERMAVRWLDQARYADTNGYSIDGGRHMWLWRDWVIDAYTRNLPFDQFLTEQLAGDLLPGATEAQRVATGFSRNHMITHEGGTIPEENLTNYAADRVKTTGEVFLGLTLACAQCHDHKYDPISQREYFRLFAYFNTLSDRGLDGDGGFNAQPHIRANTPLRQDAEVAAIRTELTALTEKLHAPHQGQPAWEESLRQHLAGRGHAFDLAAADPIKVTTPNRAGASTIHEAERAVEISAGGGIAAYNVSVRLPALDRPVTGLRITFFPVEGALGFGSSGSFVLTSFSASAGAIPADQVDLYAPLAISGLTASRSAADRAVHHVLDDRNHNGWSPGDGADIPAHITFTFDQPLDARATPYLTAMLNFGNGSNAIARRFVVSAITGTDTDTNVPPAVQRALAGGGSDEDKEAVRSHFAETSPDLAPTRTRMANLTERLVALTSPQPTMVMDVAEAPRATHVLERGQYDQPREEVFPGTPAILPSLPDGPFGGRLGLARWLTDPTHPLTARVATNRLWEMLFGTGIVATTADFGAQGEFPSHPDLLDWLATEFVESGWDTRQLIGLIVSSATYQQYSGTTPEQLRTDPRNRLLARGARFRLDAEFVRDSALKISGLLVGRVGGPSVHPYQPAGLWKEVSHYGSSPATAQAFVQDHGENLYRRSLYTFWKRTVPPPSMATFDAPSRETCTVGRESTNTPLQALVLLNDPQFVEAARNFAARILAIPEPDRLDFAFRQALSRVPRPHEAEVIRAALGRERAYYEAHPGDAAALLQIGESPTDPGLPAVEHAAWTAVAQLVLNLSETITRP
ncbi:PSD1 and planctomycete cytochrome C domain-containing protein [soil metagenome]